MAEGAGLENRCTRKGIVGSNPTLSVFCRALLRVPHRFPGLKPGLGASGDGS